MANVKEKAIRKEFQIRQRADLLSLYRTLCEKERAVVDAADSGRAGSSGNAQKTCQGVAKALRQVVRGVG
jgi:hypothetical protein